MEKEYIFFYQTKIGKLAFCSTDDFVSRIYFENELDTIYKKAYIEKEHPLIKKMMLEVTAFLEGKSQHFTVPVKQSGTPFQEQVWQALTTIPYGETRSYQDIAVTIENPQAVRAVGGANNKNKLPIVIPCHRVVGKSGKLVGFGGGLSVKEQLLSIEALYKKESE